MSEQNKDTLARTMANKALVDTRNIGAVDLANRLSSAESKLSTIESGANVNRTEAQIITSINNELGNTDWQSSGGGGAGTDGDSAYEIAVNNGFIGTESAWLLSLVGADGQDGSQGIQGEPGTANASSVAIDDTNLTYEASNVQEALEKQQDSIIYGGTF